MCQKSRRYCAAIAVLLGLALSISTVAAADDFEFQAGEAVDVIQVRLDVSPDGADLDEPLALDLGLGFPCWLHPVGRNEDETIPFGAVPQESTAARTVKAGSSVTFTFRLEGDSGRDVLQTTPQLLSGVLLSDIARVGFSSRGSTSWALSGYEITINGTRLAAGEAREQHAKEVQDAARFRLAELQLETASKREELTTLAALARSGLASEQERQQLEQLLADLQPQMAEIARLVQQVAGHFPWLLHADFQPVGRSPSLVTSAKVRLVTATHSGADTANRVFFRTGGHKYLLQPQDGLLSGQTGPVEFELDLASGPLTSGDLRGYALGMLAQPAPFGQTPDRWHPVRLLIEIDGRTVYDSDENPLDHASLEAVRIIPPVHFDQHASPVINMPVARETILWEAGKGLGLDNDTGLALDLPDPADPAYPDPEPGLADVAGANLETTEPVPEQEIDPGFSDGADLFPGEDQCADWAGDGSDWGGDFGGSWDGGWEGGWDGGWEGEWDGDDPWDDLLGDDEQDEAVDPGADGESFQVIDVAITHGWRTTDDFTVHWNVEGDEAAISHYHVYLLPVNPHAADNPIGLPILTLGENLPPGTSQVTAAGPGVAWDGQDGLFWAPQVVAVPLDDTATPHERIGPAKAILPSIQELQFRPDQGLWFLREQFDGDNGWQQVDPDGEPAGDNPAVWRAGVCEGRAILFSDHEPGARNTGIRRTLAISALETRFLETPLAGGSHCVVAHLGFMGSEAVNNQVHAVMYGRLSDAIGGVAEYETEAELITTPDDPQPMALLRLPVDTAHVGLFPPYELRIRFRFDGGHQDIDGRPGLFGVRVERE